MSRTTPVPPGGFLRLPIALIALLAGAASADVTPMLNTSSVVCVSRAGPTLDTKVLTAPLGPPDPWNGSNYSYASDPPNSALATMAISFSVSSTGMRVFTSGAANAFQDGMNQASANLDYFFTSTTVQSADFTVSLVPHDLPSPHAGALLFPLEVRGNVPYTILATNWGSTATSVRIPPGTWLVHAFASYDSTGQNGTAPGFEVDATVASTPAPLVTTQPTAQTVAPGSTANFSVGVAGGLPASATTVTTYQWRRNLVALADGGRISGTTTNHLAIASAVVADTGYYDVIVTQGAIVEGSRLAKLAVSSNTGVPGRGAIARVELDPPFPNPSAGPTRVRFRLPATMTAGLDVVDVSGRLVKTLLPAGAVAAGETGAEWDGTGTSGSRVAPGLYFFRLRAGSQAIVRRVVSLASN